MSAHSSKRFRFTFHLQSAHFSYPAPSVARDLGKIIQNQFRNTTAPWKPAQQLLSTVSWWHCGHRLCAVWFQGRRFPLPLTMLVGLGIDFHSCSWCLVPLEMHDLALFPNSPPFCTWPSSPLCMRGWYLCESIQCWFCTAGCVLHSTETGGSTCSPERVWDTHTHIHVQTQQNPDFEKPGTTLVHRNALVFSSHLSYPPLHDIGLYLLL